MTGSPRLFLLALFSQRSRGSIFGGDGGRGDAIGGERSLVGLTGG